ncbi:MAG: hypothetical protein KGJ23_12540 [Euryarchaeota archaeon]|nr:hypothetical protein [Euryarchaeota archaeon]MDE1837426.1 hypothetical protein [Euryarchaeota archaeon]MDE1881951.1 hypothetical protein [Euryarchaeota archaeon]MDE2045608.1 hypothetical protein [Thermoplasmata archaeon]
MRYPNEPSCSLCAKEGRRSLAVWAVVGGQWPLAEGETELPFQRERRLQGTVMAHLCNRHKAEWTDSWGLRVKKLDWLSAR